MEQLFSDSTSSIVSSDRVLYTASSFARVSLLHLQEIGSLQALKPHVSSRSDIQSFLFFVVVEGTGSLTYDGKDYVLAPGQCVFIDCRWPYSHSTGMDGSTDLWTLKWVHFYGPTMPLIYSKYCERGGHPVFSPGEPAPFFTIIDSVMSIARSSDYMRDMKINAALSELLVHIMAESWHPEDRVLTGKKSDVSEVKSYLDQNYASKISLDDLCTRFYISKHYLTHSFKKQYGVSITSYLLLVRITHAKQLLRFSEKSVEEIGYETGVGAPHYFSRVFKSIEGVSPAVYRAQW